MSDRETSLGGNGVLLLVAASAVLLGALGAFGVAGGAGGATPTGGANAGAVAGGEQTAPAVDVVLNETYDVSRGDSATALVALPGGGYLLGGTVRTPDSDTDAVVLEIAATGTLESARRFGGPEDESLADLVRTTDGGYALVGATGTVEETDFWVVKVDRSGAVAVNRSFGIGGRYRESANAVVATADGGIAVVGKTAALTDQRGTAPLLYELDANGDLLDYTVYERPVNRTANDLVRVPGGGYLIVGGNDSRLSGTAWISRVDGTGDRIWTKRLRDDTATSVVRTGDGNYVVGGTAGRVRWVSADPMAGYYRFYTGWLWRIDSDGTTLRKRTLDSGFPATSSAIARTQDGGAVLAYDTVGGLDTVRDRSGIVEQRDAGGAVEWNRTLGVANWSRLTAVAVAGRGRYAAAGVTNGSLWLVELANATTRNAATVSRVAFDYDDFGGTVNLEVNGDRRTPGNLVDLDGATVGGATVSVPDPATDRSSGEGTAVVTGTIRSFSVGGQEFLLDNVTFGPHAGTVADVEFGALTPTKSAYAVGDGFVASPSGVRVSVEPYVIDGETYSGGSASRSDGDDPVLRPTNVNLRFNLSTVADGARTPHIDEDSLQLAPYPVETGESPRLRITVSNVGPDGEVFVRRTVDGVEKQSISLHSSGGDVWAGDLPAYDDPGTNVSLEIVARNDAGTDTLARFPAPETASPDRSPLRYYTFTEVKRVAVLLGRFPGDSLPAALQDPGTRRLWQGATEVRLNQFFGSGDGSMGAVGFDLVFRPSLGGFYTVDRTRAEYRTMDGPEEEFLEDLRSAASGDVGLGSYAFFVGTHPGGPGTDLLSDGNGVYKTGRLNEGGNRIYVAMGATAPGTDLPTWPHEFGHALGFDHFPGDGPGVPVTDALMQSAGGRLSMAVPTRLGTTVTPAPEHPDDVDWLSKDVVDLALIPASGRSVAVPARGSYELGDAVPTIRVGATDALDGALATEYVLETRPPAYPFHEARTIVYRDGRPVGNEVLTDAGESLTSVPSADPTGPCVRFTQVGATGSGDAFEASVRVEPVPCTSDGVLVALEDGTSVAGTPDVASGGNATAPDLDLRAVDAAGRVTGTTADGRFVNEIPGANASGDANGLEWIAVPESADVRFVVGSDDIARFLNRSGVDRANVTVSYRTSVVSYGETPTVERSGRGYTVTDAAGTVTESRSLAPGATAAALDGSVVAAADVSPARPAPGERVTIDGSLSVGLNTSVERYEWTVLDRADGDRTGDNGSAGNGTSATGSTLTRSFETAGTKRVRLTVTGADGTSDSTTVAVRVVPPAPDVNGDGRPATDPDGDGRYEDVTGDGSVTVVDVAVLLDALGDPSVTGNVDLFDFETDGAVNVVDVAELLRAT